MGIRDFASPCGRNERESTRMQTRPVVNLLENRDGDWHGWLWSRGGEKQLAVALPPRNKGDKPHMGQCFLAGDPQGGRKVCGLGLPGNIFLAAVGRRSLCVFL